MDAITSNIVQEREEALRRVIYLATHYTDRKELDQAVAPLYNLYRFGSNEPHLIMALSALAAIGDAESMRLLSEDIQWEKSEKVRWLVKAVVAGYFSVNN